MKTCFKCAERKPLSEFYPHPRMADGHLNKCKACAKQDVTACRERRAEYYRHYDTVRYLAFGPRGSGPSRVVVKQAKARWEAANRHKRAAHCSVNNAVRAGKLKKPTACSHCGGGGRIYGHHADYSKPLDVEWLCARCHGVEHRRRQVSETDVADYKQKRLLRLEAKKAG